MTFSNFGNVKYVGTILIVGDNILIYINLSMIYLYIFYLDLTDEEHISK